MPRLRPRTRQFLTKCVSARRRYCDNFLQVIMTELASFRVTRSYLPMSRPFSAVRTAVCRMTVRVRTQRNCNLVEEGRSQMVPRHRRRVALLVFSSLIFAVPTFAQQDTGGIEGVVRDSSGGVLPGVTVEVLSPALIERSRTTVTETTGNYRFLRLPVGTYNVKFSLTG